MLRNIPAACDFNFTATWLAGRLFAFKSTVPEIFPSICSELRTCALAIGAQTTTLMLTKRIARNPDFSERFLTFCNLHSISTCCALLRHFLRRLGGWGATHTAANCHFQQSPSGCGCGLASAALHHSPETNRRVRGPIPPIYAPRMPQRQPLHPPPDTPLKNDQNRFAEAALRLYLLFFHCGSAILPQEYSFSIRRSSHD